MLLFVPVHSNDRTIKSHYIPRFFNPFYHNVQINCQTKLKMLRLSILKDLLGICTIFLPYLYRLTANSLIIKHIIFLRGQITDYQQLTLSRTNHKQASDFQGLSFLTLLGWYLVVSIIPIIYGSNFVLKMNHCVTNTLQLPSFSPRSTYFLSIS